MKRNTHDRTPRPNGSKLVKGLLMLCGILVFIIFCLLSFACFYYAKSIVGGISVILIPILMTAIILTHIRDMESAYVEIIDDEIYVVDYYWGIKKEKHFTFSDITSAEICIGYSHKVKGYRFGFAGMRYIVFKNGDKYLFKIIDLPETAEIFKQYIR
ncbi:MAG: hypothetical protein IJN60_00675 [Oscillospiraceae bacterium]|nr:hypothetical protein [Oscillospiraceae bacterium]